MDVIRLRSWRPLFAALCALTIVASVGSAEAAPSASDKLAAKALFEAGRALTKANNFAEACPKLLESQQLDPSLVTEFFLADCYEHTGQIATAWIYYDDVANLALAAGQTSRGTFARDRADALKARVPKLTIEVPAEMKGWPDLSIWRDQSVVSPGQWGVTVSIDPAKVTISAGAKGKKSWSVTIEVKEGKSETVKVPVLEDLGGSTTKPAPPAPPLVQPVAQPPAPPATLPKALPPAPPAVQPKAQPPTPLPVNPTPPKRSLVPSYVLFGLGGASAVTGIVLAATGFAAKNDYDKNPTSEGADKVDRHALTADVAFINAVLFGASGLIWWLGNRPSDPKALAPTTSTAPRAFIAPRMGVTGGTFDAGFTF